MYEILKDICNKNNWEFLYGTKDWQNLIKNSEKGEIFLLADPITRTPIFGTAGNIESFIYSSGMFLSISSDFDTISYDDKYIANIKPLIDNQFMLLAESLNCVNDLTIQDLTSTEAINLFDENFDGLLIQYKITIDL